MQHVPDPPALLPPLDLFSPSSSPHSPLFVLLLLLNRVFLG